MTVSDRLLDRNQAAERLNVSEATVRRLCKAGHLPRVQVSVRMWRIPEAAVTAFIAARTEGGAVGDAR